MGRMKERKDWKKGEIGKEETEGWIKGTKKNRSEWEDG